MSELNRFLKVMNRMGYPNPSTITIARSMDYDLDMLLTDLVDEVGEERAEEFTENALEKLSEDGKGIRIPLGNDRYIYLQIFQSRIDLDEMETSVLIDWSWGDSKLTGVNEDGNEYDATIEELYDNIGMGDWGEWDEMVDEIKEMAYDHIKLNCGFGIWFDRKQ
jgi:hypothetical protein